MKCLHCRNGTMVLPPNNHPSYILCDSCGAIELTYAPQDYQNEMHATPYLLNEDGSNKIQIIGIFGGYGSAKSRGSLEEVFLRALENPNGTGLLTAPTLQQLKRTTLKTLFNEVIPPFMIESYNKSDGEIRLINGFTFFTIPSDDEEKLRSITCGIVHMEEASGIAQSIYVQLLTRMRDPFVKNKLMCVCSNPDSGWIKSVIYDNAKRANPKHPEHEDYHPGITCYIWETKLNKFLPPDFITNISKGRPDWWKRKFLEGSMEHSEGAVYPNFAQAMIDPLPLDEDTDKYGIPKHWERCFSLDHGLRNPTAVPFGAIDPVNGVLYIYHEYYVANRLVPEHAKHLKPQIDEVPAGLNRFMVGDPSIRNRTDPVNGKSVLALYQEYGMYFQPGNNDVIAGILRVNSYIERGKLKVYNTCVNGCREMLGYKFPELDIDDDKNLDENPLKKDDHWPDALRYMLMNLPEDPELLKGRSYESGPYKPQEEDFEDLYDEYRDQLRKGDFLSYGY